MLQVLLQKTFFLKPQKELPLVALLQQEKIVFFSPGFPLPSGAKPKFNDNFNSNFKFSNQQSKISN
jgi:hypothetical protein